MIIAIAKTLCRFPVTPHFAVTVGSTSQACAKVDFAVLASIRVTAIAVCMLVIALTLTTMIRWTTALARVHLAVFAGIRLFTGTYFVPIADFAAALGRPTTRVRPSARIGRVAVCSAEKFVTPTAIHADLEATSVVSR